MAAISRLGRQLEEVAATLKGLGVRYALIGGLALASHKVVRATQEALDDLMAAVEASCPSWPPREVFRAGDAWRL